MDSQRQNDVSPEAMQARIQQARREAEGLKDRIKRKKDELADAVRKSCSRLPTHRSSSRERERERKGMDVPLSQSCKQLTLTTSTLIELP